MLSQMAPFRVQQMVQEWIPKGIRRGCQKEQNGPTFVPNWELKVDPQRNQTESKSEPLRIQMGPKMVPEWILEWFQNGPRKGA